MGSHVIDYDYSIPPFIVANLDSSNESTDDDFEESIFNVEEENISEISLSNDMDTSVMDSDDYEDHSPEIISVEDNIEDISLEVDTTEGITTTDSEGENDESIIHVMKKMKYDINEQVVNEAAECSDDTNKCPICLESWNNSGEHRLCSLRCGHLFGYNCIKLWLNSDNNGAKNCPQCHAKSSIRHIRFLYANKLTSLDNSEVERMKEELKQVRQREFKIRKALMKEKEKSRKYKQMYKSRTLALTVDSDFCFSD